MTAQATEAVDKVPRRQAVKLFFPLPFALPDYLGSIKRTLRGKPSSFNAPFTQSDLPIFPTPSPHCSHALFCGLFAHLYLV